MAKFLWWDINLRDDEAEEEQEFQQLVKESIPAFKSKGEALPDAQLHAQRGEGWEHIQNIPGFNKLNLGSFNSFYSKYINKTFENERGKIYEYRDMANFLKSQMSLRMQQMNRPS